MLTTPTGNAPKLQTHYTGPFIVDTEFSDLGVILKHTTTGLCRNQSVSINHLEMPYVRAPTPMPYLIGRVTSCRDIVEIGDQTDCTKFVSV